MAHRIVCGCRLLLVSAVCYLNGPAITWCQSYCMDGNQGECSCYTTPLLCTVDDLEGYTFTMSSYQHPLDAPYPLCFGDGWGVPNNPTWLAFVAWCNQVTITFKVLSCEPFGGNLNGIQVAIFDECITQPIACATELDSCNLNDKTLTFGMAIGEVYYILIDGCSGGSCIVELDVHGVCGSELLGEWTGPIIGADEICTGSEEIYYAHPVLGANFYHWYIDGILIQEDYISPHLVTIGESPAPSSSVWTPRLFLVFL